MEPDVNAKPLIGPREEVALMAGYYSPQLDVAVRLNTNEAPEPPPPGFVEALESAVGDIALNRYPDREADDLRSAVASLHGVGRDQVYCANGSNEVLQSLLLAYGGSGRVAAVFEPTYALHSHIAHVTATRVVVGGRDTEFLIDEDEVDRVFAKCATFGGENPAITFICSPNNPTGRVEPTETISAVLDRAPGLVVVDEAYGQFAPRSALELASSYRNLVVVRTFSKTWSLAALRLGYAIADPEVIEALWRVTLPYHLDAVKQAAGIAALSFEPAMHDRVRRLIDSREWLIAEMGQLDVDLCPSDANFILFRVRSGDSKSVWSRLVDRSVLVRDISGIPHLDGYLRVTVGTAEENAQFVDALRECL